LREGEQSYAESPYQALRPPGYRRSARGHRNRADGDACGRDWRERFALVGAQFGDASFVASGPTLESLFRNASEELLALTVERADQIQDRVASDVMLVETELDFLLPRFMNGLVYLRETGLLLLRAREVRLDLSEKIRMHCHLAGEIFDPDRHKLIREVTRVSTHPLRFLHGRGTWEALVALHL